VGQPINQSRVAGSNTSFAKVQSIVALNFGQDYQAEEIWNFLSGHLGLVAACFLSQANIA
jgi:hypothetical protein